MRIHYVLVCTLGLALPTAALAKADSNESQAERATRLGTADDTGTLRDANLHAVTLDGRPIAEGDAAEHTATVAADDTRTEAPLSGALEELVARQMEHNAALFDRCIADAKKRDPSLHGDLELQITIAQKKASAQVQTPNVALTSCLTKTAKSLRVSLPDLRFPWKISLGVQLGGAPRATIR